MDISEKNRPGARWRILARDGERKIAAQNDGVFDELVIDDWVHLEQMDDNTWWMRVETPGSILRSCVMAVSKLPLRGMFTISRLVDNEPSLLP
jgi:hypothetical protein